MDKIVIKEIKNRKERNLDTFLEIIGNPTRRAILSKTAKVPLTIKELSDTLKISRQAVHSQMELLKKFYIVEEFDISGKKGKAYKIKDNISIHIDLSPNYFNIKHNLDQKEEKSDIIDEQISEIYSDLDEFKDESEKIHYLGKKIKELDNELKNLDYKRNNIILRKECLLGKIKENLDMLYNEESGLSKVYRNQGKEILSTFFFSPEKFFGRFNIENLIDEMFYLKRDEIEQAKSEISIKILLKDMSKLMDFLWKEDENDWFFDF